MLSGDLPVVNGGSPSHVATPTLTNVTAGAHQQITVPRTPHLSMFSCPLDHCVSFISVLSILAIIIALLLLHFAAIYYFVHFVICALYLLIKRVLRSLDTAPLLRVLIITRNYSVSRVPL